MGLQEFPKSTITFVDRGLTIPVVDSPDVPDDPETLGRLIYSQPLEAKRGATILTSHIQTRRRPGVLKRVLDLRPGELLAVTDTSGETSTFRAVAMNSYVKSQLPPLQYPSGNRTLFIVTCTGTIRPDGHFSDNLVMEFRPVRPIRELKAAPHQGSVRHSSGQLDTLRGMNAVPWPAVVSRNIRAETARAGLTYAQLSMDIGMNRSAVGYRWRDERQWTLAEIEVVAQRLGLRPIGLCREEGPRIEDRVETSQRNQDNSAFKIHKRTGPETAN